MVTTVSSVTPTTDAPQRAQGEQDYSDTADAWAASLNATTTSWNASIAEFNVAAVEVNDNSAAAVAAAAAAEASADVSSSNANFVGNWSDQVGAANVPYSVAHDDETWILLENLADVTAEEPTTASTKWQQDSISFETAMAISLYF